VKRALACVVLAATVLAGCAKPEQGPRLEFPAEIVKLVPKWISEAEALGANDTAQPWYAQAKEFLDGAKTAKEQGRVRTVLFDLETYTELVLAGQANDTAQKLPTDADRKTYVVQRASEWRAEASAAWRSYRTYLRSIEGDLHSVQAVELAMYSADNALSSYVGLNAHDDIIRAFQRAPGYDAGYLVTIVRADHTTLQNIAWSRDMLAAAGEREGLPPRLVAENWSAITQAALNGSYDEPPSYLKELEDIGREVRAGNETTLSVVVTLAEERAKRATGIMVMFGDAQTRGLPVVHDETYGASGAGGMSGQLNNTTMSLPRGYGLAGVFTADAIDRGLFTVGFVERGLADLNTVTAAWSELDHAGYVTAALAAASPVTPPPTPEKASPAPWLAGLAAIAALSLALGRRR
jgi:hypothetical protein